MAFENDFYTVAFLKAFAKSAQEYADKESALLCKIRNEYSFQTAEYFHEKLNEEAARIAASNEYAEKSA